MQPPRNTVRHRVVAAVCAAGLIFTGAAALPHAAAVGNGPGYGGDETINTSILHTHDELVAELKRIDAAQPAMELEVIGQSLKDRDIYLAKYVSDPDNPTILYVTQQHGNEQLTAEGALDFMKSLRGGNARQRLAKVNLLFVPMVNPDGAMGDVDFPLDDHIASGPRHLTRANAAGVDLNRDHVAKTQPETRALHENVLAKYDIDYMIDLHHQGTTSRNDEGLVSGSILYPTSPTVAAEVVERSKRLGAVVREGVESHGWGNLGRSVGGSANTIGRNGIATEYGISTLLFEMRGMSDHARASAVLGQKSNGYLIKQTVVTLDATSLAVANGDIDVADTSFWDSFQEQY